VLLKWQHQCQAQTNLPAHLLICAAVLHHWQLLGGTSLKSKNIMTPELLAMLGGGVSGFVMKMIAAQADNQARLFERMIARQTIADESADKAAARGGVYMRRAITAAVIFAIVIAPFVFAFTDIGVSIQTESKGFLGLFKRLEWSTVQGFVILPEIRQTALAIVGFYFGSSQVK